MNVQMELMKASLKFMKEKNEDLDVTREEMKEELKEEIRREMHVEVKDHSKRLEKLVREECGVGLGEMGSESEELFSLENDWESDE